MGDLSITLDTSRIQRDLSDMQKQIPYATSVAVNSLAFDAMRLENSAMSEIFDNPRPFTTRATQVDKATKLNPTAVVSLRDQQAKYLTPYETGGDHWVGARDGTGDLLVPVDGRTDTYGQIPRGLIKRLLARPDVFAGTVRGIRGIWQRPTARGTRRNAAPAKLKLLYMFRPNKAVDKHLNFEQRATELVQREGPKAIEAAILKTISTAR
ncbi:hypothetical protein LV564_05020 [Komagataeibacter nataicola]|uniref:hypothetical protein n=1 Tax=Komagataeibacter nataicola TaxID=265960 RepID=UPI0023DD52E3|nr:hypothetical protein [Komagataeibacter nataicola]WEQ56450.1 hypothetical protein LV564_05020 [Komagataeibacter nataicola]